LHDLAARCSRPDRIPQARFKKIRRPHRISGGLSLAEGGHLLAQTVGLRAGGKLAHRRAAGQQRKRCEQACKRAKARTRQQA
jgi:hypothetical protein